MQACMNIFSQSVLPFLINVHPVTSVNYIVHIVAYMSWSCFTGENVGGFK